MTSTYTNTTATNVSAAWFHDQNLIEVVAYSFSPYHKQASNFAAHKVFLDILFVHPKTEETITLRTTAPAHLLCSNKDEIEATIYREIRSTLSFQGTGLL